MAVSRVQGDHEVDIGEIRLGDVAELEAQALGTEAPGELLALRDDVRLQVEPEHVDLASVHARQQVVEREGEVGPARAEVDDPEASLREARDDVLDELDEAVHLPELRSARSANATVRRLHAEGDEVRDGRALGQQVALGAVVGGGRCGASRRLAEDAGIAATREDLPVGVRLVEECLAVVLPDRRREQPRQRLRSPGSRRSSWSRSGAARASEPLRAARPARR